MESVTRAFLLSYQPPPHHHSLSLSLSLRPAVIPLSAMPPLSSFSPSPLFFFGFLQFPRPGKPCRCKLTEIGNKSRRYRCKTRDTDRPPPRNHLCSSCTRGTWRACFGVIRFLLSDFSAYFFFFFFLERKIFRDNLERVSSDRKNIRLLSSPDDLIYLFEKFITRAR